MYSVENQGLRDEEAIPLSRIEAGKTVRLISIHAGREMKSRLADMGLVPGVEFRVIRNTGNGPFIIAVKESRLALGHGMIERMFVKLGIHFSD